MADTQLELELAIRRFKREREARIAAEGLLEQKAMELFKSNEKLHELLDSLDNKVRQRTEELRVALAEAQAASRVKTDFLAMISHEIRTPMNAIHGVAQILEAEPLPAQQKELVALILSSSTSLLAIVNDLLDLSKIDAGKLKLEQVQFTTAQLAHDIKELFAVKAQKKNLRLIIETSEDANLLVEGDPGRLRQILINLVDNALKYTQKGSVTLAISAIDVADSKKSFCFTVVDTGPGIPEDKMNRLFNRFDRIDIKASNNIEGAGLGLALCKQLVDLLNGKIGCSSTLGAGSSFWATVPLKVVKKEPASEPVTPDESAKQPSHTQVNPCRILVAEDNVANQIIIRVMLEKMGHIVDIAADGVEAVSAVKLLNYDMVLMDMQMPAMDGLEATKAIRALAGDVSQVPIYALTANAMEADKNKCLDVGMNGFLSKPVSRNDLVRVLATLGGH